MRRDVRVHAEFCGIVPSARRANLLGGMGDSKAQKGLPAVEELGNGVGHKRPRRWARSRALAEAIFISPAARILFASLLTAVLVLGVLASTDSPAVHGWVPTWFKDAYTAIAAALSIQPILAGVGTAVTKRKRDQWLRQGLDSGLGKLIESVRDIGRINTQDGWGLTEARRFERRVIDSIQPLLVSAGIVDARVCFYETATTDTTLADPKDRPVINSLHYVYNYPQPHPTRSFERSDPEAAGLFDALDTGQPSRELDRPNYDRDEHRWRSALRVPVEHEGNLWGVLTVDSPKKAIVDKGSDSILSFAAALLAIARLCGDGEGGPTSTDIQELVQYREQDIRQFGGGRN